MARPRMREEEASGALEVETSSGSMQQRCLATSVDERNEAREKMADAAGTRRWRSARALLLLQAAAMVLCEEQRTGKARSGRSSVRREGRAGRKGAVLRARGGGAMDREEGA